MLTSNYICGWRMKEPDGPHPYVDISWCDAKDSSDVADSLFHTAAKSLSKLINFVYDRDKKEKKEKRKAIATGK